MFSVNRFDRVPVYEQIILAMEREICSGVYRPGDQIPSLRELSAYLSINPNTIQKAYAELVRRGLLCVAQGYGYYVSEDADRVLRKSHEAELTELEKTLRTLASAGVSREDVTALLDRVYPDSPSSSENKT